MAMLSGDGGDLRGELLAMGVEISYHARYRLAEYLQNKAPKRRVECVLQTGWVGTDFKAFVLPDTVIGPASASVVYQSGARGSEEYAVGGTLDGWQTGIAAMAVGNPMLVLGLCAAFAGPVLARCGQESGGIHFIGDSSTSVWGGSGLKRSWRATSNGLEGASVLSNDVLLALDEISECDPRQVGELSIATPMTEGGHRIKAGQSVRLLVVPAQRAHGAWDKLHQYLNGTEFADAIKRAAVTNYGHVGGAHGADSVYCRRRVVGRRDRGDAGDGAQKTASAGQAD